jgi:hypothetical protein
VIQRFNSALGASSHFHTLFLDGVYSFRVGRAPVCHPTPGPTDEDMGLWNQHVELGLVRRMLAAHPNLIRAAYDDVLATQSTKSPA